MFMMMVGVFTNVVGTLIWLDKVHEYDEHD